MTFAARNVTQMRPSEIAFERADEAASLREFDRFPPRLSFAPLRRSRAWLKRCRFLEAAPKAAASAEPDAIGTGAGDGSGDTEAWWVAHHPALSFGSRKRSAADKHES